MPQAQRTKAVKAPLPREHGAWGLLLQPFVGGALLANYWTWRLIPALGLVLLGFLLREPLVILARQQFVWKTQNPQTAAALRWLIVQMVGVAVCSALLLATLPALPFLVLLGAAIAITVLSVWVAVNNRQRSIPFQVVSAAGLATGALLAILAARGQIAWWAWLFWAMLSVHGTAAILVVHARLRLRMEAARGGASGNPRRWALAAQAVQLTFAAALAWNFGVVVALPPAFSASANLLELYRLGSPERLNEPLVRVGFRALFVGIAHTLLAVAALWGIARSPAL